MDSKANFETGEVENTYSRPNFESARHPWGWEQERVRRNNRHL